MTIDGELGAVRPYGHPTGAARPPCRGETGSGGWARDWLHAVADARVALERAAAIVEVRRQRATRLGSPSAGGPSGKGGTNATEASMVDLVAAVEGLEATRAWAQAELDAFDRMAEANRRTLRGAMLEGLDVAEMKFRIGATDRETAEAFGVSRSKLHTDLNAFVDYLDYIGPGDALGATT